MEKEGQRNNVRKTPNAQQRQTMSTTAVQTPADASEALPNQPPVHKANVDDQPSYLTAIKSKKAKNKTVASISTFPLYLVCDFDCMSEVI